MLSYVLPWVARWPKTPSLKTPRNATSAAPPLFQCVRGRCLRLMRTEVLSGFGCFEYCQLFSCLVTGDLQVKNPQKSVVFFVFLFFFVFLKRSNRLRILLTDRLSGLVGVFRILLCYPFRCTFVKSPWSKNSACWTSVTCFCKFQTVWCKVWFDPLRLVIRPKTGRWIRSVSQKSHCYGTCHHR